MMIEDWHAHIYFNADEADAAHELGEAMRAALGEGVAWAASIVSLSARIRAEAVR